MRRASWNDFELFKHPQRAVRYPSSRRGVAKSGNRQSRADERVVPRDRRSLRYCEVAGLEQFEPGVAQSVIDVVLRNQCLDAAAEFDVALDAQVMGVAVVESISQASLIGREAAAGESGDLA